MTSSQNQSAIRLRRCILENLYAWFQDYPLASFELRRLEEVCSASTRELNWNIIYLEKKGWLELVHGVECLPYAACSTTLTGAGIDLIEDQKRFKRQFPPE